MYIYSSFSLCILPPIAYWYLKHHRLKLRLCLVGSHCVWDSQLANVPQSVTSCAKAIGGTVYILMLEKVEKIDGELCQEWSL